MKKKNKFNEFDVVLNKLKNSKEGNSSKLLKEDGNPSPEHILPKLASNKKFPAFRYNTFSKYNKGTGSVILSDPPCKDDNVRFSETFI